jgi:hypothetical protein
MNIDLVPFLVVWTILTLAVIYLYFRHRAISGKQDAGLDVLETPATAQQHALLQQKLTVVDKWGKALTVIAGVYGLALAVLYFYQNWVRMSNYGG